MCGQGSRVAALGFEGGFPAVEGAARDTEGVTGRGQSVLVEETKNFKASVGIFGCHVPKMPQSRYPVKPPDAVPTAVDLHGTPLGSQECQRFLSLCMHFYLSGDVLFFVCGAVSESVLVSFSVVRG